MRRRQRQRNGVAQQRQQPRRGHPARDAEQRQRHNTGTHQYRGAAGVLRFTGARRAEESDAVDFRHAHHRQRPGNRQPDRQQRAEQTRDKDIVLTEREEGLIDHPLSGKAV